MNALPLILTVFVACAVEAVEALTIVLAVGLTREWKSTFWGIGVALAVLAVVTAAIGPALTYVPLSSLRLVVGALLAIFGLQWLRKAVLRATGYKALHDEASAYLREVAAAEAAPLQARRGVSDWYSFTIAFKGVLLEGLEVVFIVLTFGASQHNLGAAVIGAVAAVTAASTTRATPTPQKVDFHSLVSPAAMTMVSASTASTTQATKTVRISGMALNEPPQLSGRIFG